MAVTLHFHATINAHGALPTHAADIIAPKVNKHHMLGAFLFVREQFNFQRTILRLRTTPASSTRKRSIDNGSPTNTAENLRARSDQDAPFRLQVDLIRTGVHNPQRAINIKRICRRAAVLTPAENHLKCIARTNVILRAQDRLLKLRAGHRSAFAGHRSRCDIKVYSTRRQWRSAREQSRAECIERGAAVFQRTCFISVLIRRNGNHGVHHLGNMIKDRYFSVHPEMHIRKLSIIARRGSKWKLAGFKPANRIKRTESHPTTVECVGHGINRMRREPRTKETHGFQRIDCRALFFRPAPAVPHSYSVGARQHFQHGLRAQH